MINDNDRLRYRIPVLSGGEFISYKYTVLGEYVQPMRYGKYGEPEQCTGVRDVNCNLIYENDIVHISKSYDDKCLIDLKGVVLFHNNGFVIVDAFNGVHKLTPEVEIVGNVHDNHRRVDSIIRMSGINKTKEK